MLSICFPTCLTVLLVIANFGEHSSVNAIKCFVCDNIGVHDEDEMLKANPQNVNAVCQQFADTKDLMQFAITCPAKYNACQSSHGWTDNPNSDDSHAFRSCFTVPDNAKTPDCREHYIVQGVTSCPCYYDNCNFQSTMIKTANVWTAVLASGKSDSRNLAAGGTTKAPSAIAAVQAGSGGGSGVNAGGGAGTNSASTNTGSVDAASGDAGSALASADANPQDVAARAGSGAGGSGGSNTASSLRLHPMALTLSLMTVSFIVLRRAFWASSR